MSNYYERETVSCKRIQLIGPNTAYQVNETYYTGLGHDEFVERVRKLDCKGNESCLWAKRKYFERPNYVHESVRDELYRHKV